MVAPGNGFKSPGHFPCRFSLSFHGVVGHAGISVTIWIDSCFCVVGVAAADALVLDAATLLLRS